MEAAARRGHQEARGHALGMAYALAAGDDEAPGDTDVCTPILRKGSGRYPRKTLSTLE